MGGKSKLSSQLSLKIWGAQDRGPEFIVCPPYLKAGGWQKPSQGAAWLLTWSGMSVTYF